MGRGVTLPSDEVLELLLSAEVPRFENLLYFPFRFAFYNVWWWFDKIGSVLIGLLITCEERCMEDVMYLPMRGEFDLICDWGYYGDYLERSISPWG
jgi:hypothetical protein